MSSKRRLRRKTCEGKARHATRPHALLAIRRSRYEHKAALGAYKCRHCSGWHIGHVPGSRLIVGARLATILFAE